MGPDDSNKDSNLNPLMDNGPQEAPQGTVAASAPDATSTTTPGQPSVDPVVNPVTAQAPRPGKAMSIIGLVLSVLLPIVGLVLSIVAFVKYKSKLSLVGIILGVLFTILGTIVIVVAYGGISRAAVADKFLTAIQSQKYEDAFQLLEDPKDESTREYIVNSSSKVGQSHKLVDNKANDVDKKITYSYVYELNGGESKYARVSLQNAKDGLKVVEFTYGSNKLKPEMPKDNSEDTTDNSSDSKKSNKKTTTSSTSVANYDNETSEEKEARLYANLCFDGKKLASSSGGWFDLYGDERYILLDTAIFFKGTGVDYEYESAIDTLNEVANYLKGPVSKEKIVVELKGSIADDKTDAAKNKLADDRAKKVQKELTDRGVAPGLLKIVPPFSENLGTEYGEGSQMNVGITVLSNC